MNKILLLIIPSLFLLGCFTPTLNKAKIPTVDARVADGGYYFSDDDKATITGEGVPASWFANKGTEPKPWYLTAAQEDKAGEICAAHRNPNVWPKSGS